MQNKLLSSLFALFICASMSMAKAEKFAPQAQTFFLDNGMQVVVIPDHRTPVATHMVWYKVGSADEPEGKSGIAHFLEHLMFKGTKNHPDGEFSDTVSRIGGQENAFTSVDYTGYFQRVAKEHLGLVMSFEADRMANLVLKKEQVDPEREVVLEERRSRIGNSPSSALGEEMSAALFRAHPYGRPIIGWEHEIHQLNLDDAIEFYDTYYSPNNAILIVAGDVQVDEVRELANKHYGVLERRAEPGERVRPKEPPQRAPRHVKYTNEQVTQSSFRRNYVVPSYNSASDDEGEALDILSYILGSGTTSRLYKELVVNQKVATSAGSWYQSYAYDDGRFGLYGTPVPGISLEQLEMKFDEVVQKIIEEGVSEKELTRAKNQLIASAIYAQDSQAALARSFGVALTTGSTVEKEQNWPNRIESVTAAEVKEAAQKFLRPEASVTGYLLKPEQTAQTE